MAFLAAVLSFFVSLRVASRSMVALLADSTQTNQCALDDVLPHTVTVLVTPVHCFGIDDLDAALRALKAAGFEGHGRQVGSRTSSALRAWQRMQRHCVPQLLRRQGFIAASRSAGMACLRSASTSVTVGPFDIRHNAYK